MNGPSCMYSVRPLNKFDENIEFPTRMYHMKNIQKSLCTNSDINETSRQCASVSVHQTSSRSILEQNPLPEITNLEGRQEAVLVQLQHLKQQMSLIKDLLKDSKPENTTKTVGRNQTRNCMNIVNGNSKELLTKLDLVINANPEYPPYSLIALSNIWPQSSTLRIIYHIHSSVQDVTNEIKRVFQSNEDHITQDSKDTIGPNITLIWKSAGRDAELIMSPASNITIRGEVNILRFLSHLAPQFNYPAGNNIILTTTTDAILDTCHSLLWSNTVKERQLHIQTLNANLKKSPFLLGDCISIADIAAWSVLKQVAVSKDMSVNMTKWHKKCTDIFKMPVS